MKDDRLYLEHIRDALAKVRTYTAGGRDAFLHMGVNLKRVWDVVETHLPALQKAVEERLKSC